MQDSELPLGIIGSDTESLCSLYRGDGEDTVGSTISILNLSLSSGKVCEIGYETRDVILARKRGWDSAIFSEESDLIHSIPFCAGGWGGVPVAGPL